MYETSHILVLIKILARDKITSHVITIWPARPLVSISENELNLTVIYDTCSLGIIRLPYFSCCVNFHGRLTRTYVSLISCTGVRMCARANEYVKDCYYSSQYKLGTQCLLADVSIIHIHVLEYGGVEIASQLGEEEEDEGDGAGRAHPQRRSLPICSILLSKLFVTRFQSDKYVLHVAL